MAALDYTPRPVGKRPGRRPKSADGIRSGRIALVWPMETTARSSVACALMQGLTRELKNRSLELRISFLEPSDPGFPAELTREIREADGCLVLGGGDPAQFEPLRGKPVVWMGSQGPRDFGDRVAVDNLQIARDAVAWLRGQGCTTALFTNLMPAHPACDQRRMAFVAETARVPPLATRIFEPAAGSDGDTAATLAEELVSFLGGLPPERRSTTGLFIATDRQLAELDRECRRLGFDLTGSLPVVACDHEDAALSGLLHRPATFEIQPHRIAELAVQRLTERMRDPQRAGQTTVSIPAVFVPPLRPSDSRKPG